MTESTSLRAAIYLRQSVGNDEGIARQRERCTALANSRGYPVVEVYVDNDVSATKARDESTQWAAMLRDLDAGRADVVIGVDLDRLLRSMGDLVAITATGARVLTVNGEIDLTTADGEFRASMLASIARFESRRKGERQLRANEHRRAQGKPGPGRRRYGYDVDGVTVRPDEAAVIRRIFEEVAGGASIYGLSRRLNAEGVVPTTGRPMWSPRRVRDVLTNPHYAGILRARDELIESEHIAPVISRALFDEVGAILSTPSRRTTPGPTPKHLLSGIARCGECGGPLYFMRTYICKTDTSHVSITKDRLEPPVVEALVDTLILGGRSVLPSTPEGQRLAAVKATLDANSGKVADIIADRDEGLVPRDVARARLVALKAERETAEAQLEAAQLERGAASTLLDLADGLLVGPDGSALPMSDLHAARETVRARFAELDVHQRRELTAALVEVEVAKGRDTRRVRIRHTLAPWLDDDADDPQHARD